jgi:hypothetical protein
VIEARDEKEATAKADKEFQRTARAPLQIVVTKLADKNERLSRDYPVIGPWDTAYFRMVLAEGCHVWWNGDTKGSGTSDPFFRFSDPGSNADTRIGWFTSDDDY